MRHVHTSKVTIQGPWTAAEDFVQTVLNEPLQLLALLSRLPVGADALAQIHFRLSSGCSYDAFLAD